MRLEPNPLSPNRRLILAVAPPTDPAFDLTVLSMMAAAAEEAGVDFLLFGHPFFGECPVDALSLAAALAPSTSRIGLMAAIDPRTLAPFHLARALASLDLLTAGRAGWLALLDDRDNPMACERYAEHLEVVCALFDSWEDQALVFDKPKGLFADPSLVHRIRHRGRHFIVDGPLNTPRPPQGRPVMLQSTDLGLPHVGDISLSTGGDPATSAPLRLREVTVDFRDPPLAAGPSAGPGPQAVAAWMAETLRNEDVHGFVLLPAAGGISTGRILAELVPTLATLGFRLGREGAAADGAGADLRTQLGLARPRNRFALDAKAPP